MFDVPCTDKFWCRRRGKFDRTACLVDTHLQPPSSEPVHGHGSPPYSARVPTSSHRRPQATYALGPRWQARRLASVGLTAAMASHLRLADIRREPLRLLPHGFTVGDAAASEPGDSMVVAPLTLDQSGLNAIAVQCRQATVW